MFFNKVIKKFADKKKFEDYLLRRNIEYNFKKEYEVQK